MHPSAKIALACLLLAGCADGRSPTAPSLVGSIEEPGNTQVPLPPGDWKRLASTEVSTAPTFGGGFNNDHIVSAYYARIDAGRIAQLVLVRTSAGGFSPYGYGTGLSCLGTTLNESVYYADPRNGTPNAIDCVKVTGNRLLRAPSEKSSAIYRQAWEAAKQWGGLPRHAVQVEIAQAHSNRFQDYIAYDFPDQSPAENRSPDWTLAGLTPTHRAYADSVIAWAKDFRNAVSLGTEHRL